MFAAKVAFWLSVLLLFYIYFGYPLLLSVIAILRKKGRRADRTYEPTVSLIIAAYNEEAVIGQKIQNSLQIDYPTDKLEIIVFSDASTDRTDETVRGYADRGVKLVRVEGRKGKTHCQNEAAKAAQGEVIVFSDANSMYEPQAIKKLVRNFADPTVGCVVGELRYHRSAEKGGQGVEGEGVYWRYEQIIKRLESKVSSLSGGNGAIYAVRKALFEPLPADAQDDFVRPLRVVCRGYRVLYEPEAVAWEHTAPQTAKEFRRRVRMVTRAMHSLMKDRSLISLLNPLRFGLFAVQLWSHKVLRWFSGLLLLVVFLANLALLQSAPVYGVTMALQLVFYAAAALGLLCEAVFKRRAPKVPHVAYYFCLSCYAMLKGVLAGLWGRVAVTWEPGR